MGARRLPVNAAHIHHLFHKRMILCNLRNKIIDNVHAAVAHIWK